MTVTYRLISKTTLTANASNIEFTSIPGTYTDLLLKLTGRTNSAGTQVDQLLDFNNSGNAKNLVTCRWSGTIASGFTQSSGQITGYATGGSAAANVFGTWELYLPSYASTSFTKSFVVDWGTENTVAGQMVGIMGGCWTLTSAITSVKVRPDDGALYVSGTTAQLYGIKNS